MRRSFYHYVLKYRGDLVNKKYKLFANEVYDDLTFPKHSEEYHEISSYIELNSFSINAIQIFDELWEKYEQEESQ